MSQVDILTMLGYLSRSLASLNANKINGLLAEIDFRNHVGALGYAGRVSAGGWIARSEGLGNFGRHTVAIFPETIQPNTHYPVGRQLPQAQLGLHTICATLHQIGIHSLFCVPEIAHANDAASIRWHYTQLGVPVPVPYRPFPAGLAGFRPRRHRYPFLKYHANTAGIPAAAVPDEFTKEHLRVTFQDAFLSEMSDIDGIFWGNQYTYPIEIKEKTQATDRKLGPYFGLDLGPFVKLAFYAAKRGNLHSIFVVREIDDPATRNLVNWWYVTFDRLAQFASWTGIGGGRNMGGGRSTVVAIPKAEFRVLDAAALAAL